jgi:rhodanese-related sulfurtransferase
MATDHQFGSETSTTPVAEDDFSNTVLRTPKELANIVSLFASSDAWIEKVHLRADRRWYERLYHGPDHDIWVISWLPGQSTGFHDHGESSGAFVVATGSLEEHRPGEQPREFPSGVPRAFGPDFTHDVRNASPAPAISIHAYSPPLSEMNEYELEGSRLVLRGNAPGKAERFDQEWRAPRHELANRTDALSIEQVLSAARDRLRRLSPDEAYEAVAEKGATLVDIRPESQRAMEGSIEGALVVERNVLEWRLDPASSARLPIATDHNIHLIVFCSEGYASSLAASDLQDIGHHRATDIIGGFQAWRETGLPTLRPGSVTEVRCAELAER